jgi:MscS family membrane protein
LIADRPVRVGDFCRFGETLGTIEEIGIRSTRVRTLGRTIVTVPNGEFSNLHLENFAHRDHYLFHHTVGLVYGTDPRTMRALLAAFRRVLVDHPRVTPDPARVRLVRLGAYSKDVELFAYVEAADWNEYLEIQEGLILALMEIVESSASGFAFPTQTLHLDPGREAADARTAA